jgi:hypothetical protein
MAVLTAHKDLSLTASAVAAAIGRAIPGQQCSAAAAAAAAAAELLLLLVM